MNYLKSTNYMKLTLRFESVVVVKWWIGSSYNTHKDSRVHAGGIMSLGQVSVISSYFNKKLNVNSSTVEYTLGAHSGLGLILYRKYFIKSPVCIVEHNKLYQDNNITILVETNGNDASLKITKHIKYKVLPYKGQYWTR